MDATLLPELNEKVIGKLGRDVLIKRLMEGIRLAEMSLQTIRALEGELKTQRDQLTIALREHRAMSENLKSTQARCTELLNTLRATRIMDKILQQGPSHEPLVWQLIRFGSQVALERQKSSYPTLGSLAAMHAQIALAQLAMDSAPNAKESARREEDLTARVVDVAIAAFRLTAQEAT